MSAALRQWALSAFLLNTGFLSCVSLLALLLPFLALLDKI
jgi:hypothetical protein